MWVAEIEQTDRAPFKGDLPFEISSVADIKFLRELSIWSVVVDAPTNVAVRQPSVSYDSHRREIAANFSATSIAQARRVVEEIRPYLDGVLLNVARGHGIPTAWVNDIATKVEGAALSNKSALLSLLKLRGKDTGTFLHSVSVSAMMVVFGRLLRLPSHLIRDLAIGGLVHDIGKMVLPRSILQSTGKLTPAEITIVQTHPGEGAALVGRMQGIRKPAVEITLYHHERFDGSGYPSGLAGDDIPFVARIAAICDVYDAMTSVRPYKTAFSKSDAIRLMLESNGHFDPLLLKEFVSKMDIEQTL
ncbi:HD-GYP domain-containing protein [Agrobacterium rosae]|uniref:HD-GYP domain-containing protein n=1 Tax=Agrobacterium rosae TaxID=1972867 RepID=UPI002033815F|nr:HD-GYP domain-containing protein [Agrobacterium rosae]MCM2435928.1 HD-GYP domain-containing protein [Agrobacterium rosae]